MLSFLLEVGASTVAAAVVGGGIGGDALQATPAHIQKMHDRQVNACMNDTAKGVSWFAAVRQCSQARSPSNSGGTASSRAAGQPAPPSLNSKGTRASREIAG
jgi:hypothetical protein